MESTTPAGQAAALMRDFAKTTGLDPPSLQPRRYLWTDAFAVCNYLGLSGLTGDQAFRDRALRLIGQVHHVLGRFRSGDARTGWISGLVQEEGEEHPVAGGLRIGKSLPERRPGEPYDERLEWDRDGQYYHYLTRWMHALSRAGTVTGDPQYIRQAVELARAAHAGFTTRSGGRMTMHWKMSTDLSRPLVPSMGQHDPLDGLVTYTGLRLAAEENGMGPVLGQEIDDMARLTRSIPLATEDPLGIGGLLADAGRIVQLAERGVVLDPALPGTIVASALDGLGLFTRSRALEMPAPYRLAFRELGLAIGLAGAGRMLAAIDENPDLFRDAPWLVRGGGELREYLPVRDAIVAFWLDPENRTPDTWTEHRDINTVMLATSLVPDGFLGI